MLVQGVYMYTRIALLLLVPAALVVFAAQNPPAIKKVSISSTSPASGQEMFNHYCATCHGKEGRGDGPVAAALKKAPADLTALTTHNNGKFPSLDVYNAIIGDSTVEAHGSIDMPVWGEVLKSLDGGTGSMLRLRVSNLVDYVKSLQRN